MKNNKNLTNSFSKTDKIAPLDHFDRFLINMSRSLDQAGKLLEHRPAGSEDVPNIYVLAENIIVSRYMFSSDGFYPTVKDVKSGNGFKSLMKTCSERDMHVSLTHQGDHFRAEFDPDRPFATSQIQLKPDHEPPPMRVKKPKPPGK